MQQPSYPEHIGQERNDTLQFPFRSWIDGGATLALGSDWPATPGGFEHGVNAFNNIYTSMHRIPPAAIIGELGAGDQPLPPLDQVLTVEEAVRAYTLGGAEMLGVEDEIGSIEAGKKADMILLSQNIFEIDPEQIPNTEVLATMFDGRVVHDVVYDLGDGELTDLGRHDVKIDGLCGPTSQ
jgi:predicted amidohydrolase YtcJ